MKYITLAAGIVIGVLVSWLAYSTALKQSWNAGYKSGHRAAYDMPASDQLEMVCAGMWFGHGGDKYWKAWKEKNK
jgi:hypothetical protein